MSNTSDHKAKAANNEFFVTTLQNPFWDWAVTGTFYAAVHYVEAYLATHKPAIHSRNHNVRDSNVQGDPVLKAIYDDYRELKNECHDARYQAHLHFSQGDAARLQTNLELIKKLLMPLI
ncbi:MAG TPA: hypothetical protein VHW70_12805 [Edaphobacter sp.]|nr:hypothetical protein [Edaphobacter sp.]